MKKVLSLNALLAGIVTILFSLVTPWEKAARQFINASIIMDRMDRAVAHWAENYIGLTILGMILAAVGMILLIRQRNVRVKVEPCSCALVSVGIFLCNIAALEIFDAYVQYSEYTEYVFSDILSSTIISRPISYIQLFYSVFWSRIGLGVLGVILITAGLFVNWKDRRTENAQLPAAEESVAVEAEPEAVQESVVASFEGGFALYCTVMDIRGDYALVKYDDTGIESEVALALLPFGIDTGDRLKYENYEFTQV